MKMGLRREKMNGLIVLDKNDLGFTSDKFDDNSYLWERDGAIYISFISSLYEGEGNVRKLFQTILEKGYVLKVPTPLGRMNHIVRDNGFKETCEEPTEDEPWDEPIEVWVKEK
jgi:hypothetical protein